ncbi:OmpA family protein [Thiomicrorhabdus aquaedulcis]|uniref:OmpA family protein n=1 Tax=Thiomicrorhabdus aquaedulcis TaxID=2211106 RepID=UPI000FD90CF8|nr:OmpA family protein [Thiomicrorhabdus aquaedulcis]
MEIMFLVLLLIGGVMVNDAQVEEPATGVFEVIQPGQKTPVDGRLESDLGNNHITYTKDGFIINKDDLVPTTKTKFNNSEVQNEDGVVVSSALVKPNLQQSIIESECSLESDYKVFFENNQSNLNDDSLETISTAIQAALKCNVEGVVVKGYATKVGSIEHNIELATNRANSVKQYITQSSALNVRVVNPLTATETIKPSRYATITLVKAE